MSRVFVFGLDAGVPDLIRRWRSELPTLNKLISESVWGPLHSTIPPFTSPAWSCMATGKNPAKIGIFGLRHRTQGSYEFVSPTSTSRRAPAVWDMASETEKQCIVINVPDTYPPTPLNGVMISGRPAPVQPATPITTTQSEQQRPETYELTPEEESQIEATLRNLGYLD